LSPLSADSKTEADKMVLEMFVSLAILAMDKVMLFVQTPG